MSESIKALLSMLDFPTKNHTLVGVFEEKQTVNYKPSKGGVKTYHYRIFEDADGGGRIELLPLFQRSNKTVFVDYEPKTK